MPIEPLQLLRHLQQPPHHLVRVSCFLEFRFTLDRLIERHRVGGIVRHQLAQPVHLPIRHLQNAAHVAQHRARLQFPVCDDLRNPIRAILLLNVADHLIALVLAEVDVEVRHRHTFRVEKPLKQQAEPQRIEIGDRQRIRNQRTRTRTAPRPHRNAVRLRPLDEVGHDEKVAGKLHLRDDVDLEREARPVVLLAKARRQRHNL